MDNSSNKLPLDEWNYSIVCTLIPNSVLLMLYLVIGIGGNSIVIYVYLWRMKSNMDGHYFFPPLAIADLLTCVMNSIHLLYKNQHPVTYTNDLLCKTMMFVCFNTIGVSNFFLVVIAVQRYLKICRPFGKQMTIGYKRMSLILSVFISLLYATPVYVFYGTRDVMHVTGTLGKQCTNINLRGPWAKTEKLVYKAFVTLAVVFTLFSMIVCYSLIGCVLRKRSKFMKNRINTASTTYSTSNTACTFDTEDTNRTTLTVINGKVKTRESSSSVDASNTPEGETRRNQINGLRLTIIFMWISGIFILSYIPKSVIMLLESYRENLWTELSTSEMGIYSFLNTLFIINNIVNPFIYGFFDKQFRKEFYSMIPCLRSTP